jgi:hypothetical protein
MIRQYDNSIDFEWIFLLRLLESASQSVDFFDEQSLPAVLQIMREKPACAGNKSASIVWHVKSITYLEEGGGLRPAARD